MISTLPGNLPTIVTLWNTLLFDTNWGTVHKVSTKPPRTPLIVYSIEVEGRAPRHTLNLLSGPLMRKIESQMIAAIKDNKDWKNSNTSVHFDSESGVSVVRLHGNKIAEVGDDSVKLFDGGWQSNTTKSRLNAILSEFGYTCGTQREYIFQKQFEWFIKFFDSQTKQMQTISFIDGMILA